MLMRILSWLGLAADTGYSGSHRRQHERREGDPCIGVVNGASLPVENWSEGGMLLTADDRLYGIDQICTATLRFRLPDRIVDIAHQGRIVRKTRHRVAIEFLPLNDDQRAAFQTIASALRA